MVHVWLTQEVSPSPPLPTSTSRNLFSTPSPSFEPTSFPTNLRIPCSVLSTNQGSPFVRRLFRTLVLSHVVTPPSLFIPPPPTHERRSRSQQDRHADQQPSKRGFPNPPSSPPNPSSARKSRVGHIEPPDEEGEQGDAGEDEVVLEPSQGSFGDREGVGVERA